MLGDEDKKYIQQVMETLLYYARAVHSTMLVALSTITSDQERPIKSTMEKVDQILDYSASQEEENLTHHASNMVLSVHINASYLSEPKAISRAGGHFFLSRDCDSLPNTVDVFKISQIIKSVMTSAYKAEIGPMYINARDSVPTRKTMIEMGHYYPQTLMQTENLAANSVVANNVQPIRTDEMYMRFHWIRFWDAQGQSHCYWMPVTMNFANYWTNHPPASHHKNMRPVFLTSSRHIEDLHRLNGQASTKVALAQVIDDNTTATRVC